MQKLIAEQNYQKERTSTGLITALVAMVVVLSIVRVFLANWLVESSETLRSLDKKIAEQATINQTLAEDLREKKSLATIEDQAKIEGYVPLSRLTFITTEPSVAANSQILTLVR